MKIKTRDFGEVEINPNEIIIFSDGLPGIVSSGNRFVILSDEQGGGPIYFMQSLDDEELAFVLVDMALILPEYVEAVAAEQPAAGGLHIYNIATIHENLEDSTVNLKAPLIVDFAGKSGWQVLCKSDEFPIRAKLFEEGGGAC